jgi:23S rRNA (uracil1939-C5)-methyltransferase
MCQNDRYGSEKKVNADALIPRLRAGLRRSIMIDVEEREETVRIEKVTAGGAGLGRLAGKVVFVPYTLPEEDVRVRIVREKKDYAQALPLEILRPSPKRCAPRCSLFGLCGGCDFQHTGYAEQKEIKRDIVRETFRRIGHFDINAIAFEESLPFGYRRRVQLHKTALGDAPRWGFRKAGDTAIVPAGHCPVAVPEINDFLASPEGDFPGGQRIQVFGWNGRAVFRREEEIRLELCGRAIIFSPDCFFQSNIPALEKLCRAAFTADLRGDYALDLYGGVGTFGVFLVERFRRVVSVEENPLSAAYARRNLDPGKARVFSETVEKWLVSPDGPGRGGAGGKTPDIIVLDPPRAGLSPALRAFLKKAGSPLILYISCDTGSLARDSAFLRESGYSLAEYRLFDFYPQTAHVESLCRFTLNG